MTVKITRPGRQAPVSAGEAYDVALSFGPATGERSRAIADRLGRQAASQGIEFAGRKNPAPASTTATSDRDKRVARQGIEFAAPVFTHPADHTAAAGCLGQACTAVQFMCPRCGVHGFGDHCAEETATGNPVAWCFNCDDWVTGRADGGR